MSLTGSPIRGTLEHLTPRANVTGIHRDGEPEWEGYIEIFGEEQETVCQRRHARMA